jgi:hypothetical protein
MTRQTSSPISPWYRRPRWWLIGGIALLVLGALHPVQPPVPPAQDRALLSAPAPSPAQERSRELRKISGARGYLVAIGQTDGVPLARDREAINALVRTNRIGDDYGQLQLLLSGRFFHVPTGTPVLIINTSWDLSQVRVLDGPQTGQTGWVIDDQIRITTAAPRR